jgi:hypothetical protein
MPATKRELLKKYTDTSNVCMEEERSSTFAFFAIVQIAVVANGKIWHRCMHETMLLP